MNKVSLKGVLNFWPCRLTLCAMPILLLIVITMDPALAQKPDNLSPAAVSTPDAGRKLFGGTITNSGYGGIILKFSTLNNQFAFMSGGRGACTINNQIHSGWRRIWSGKFNQAAWYCRRHQPLL